jgi:hypothetical protein
VSDVWRALAISASILLPVVVLIIIVSMVAVRRGEGGLAVGHHGPDELVPAAAGPAKAAKPAGPVIDEISVPLILLLGLGLFTITVLALLGLSLLQHMG